MHPRADEDSRILKEQIQHLDDAALASEAGTVLSVDSGIARIHGLPRAMAGEHIEFTDQEGLTRAGLVLTLERDTVGAAVFGDICSIKEGDTVTGAGRLFDVPVGEALLGRVVDTLGQPIDGKGPIEANHRGRVERKAPSFLQRAPVTEQLLTGIKILDACVPLSRGQQKLILGDRKIGKTALAVDTILNQRGKGIFCVYVAIGQRLSAVRQVVDCLSSHGALEYTVVVVAAASEAAPARVLAPFTGMALGEYFRDTGRHALCVFDDLTKHAVAHGEISLLLGRLPGREGYPADLVSLHGRLLGRAGVIAGEPHSGGSLTALAVVETEAGDVSAYLPANLISMADGRISLDFDLFNAGIRPAVDISRSVSNVGWTVQNRTLRQLAGWKSRGGPLPLHLAEHRALAEFARFTPDLDTWTRARLDHGARLVEIMKQRRGELLAEEKQILILFAAVRGLLDDLPASDLPRFEEGLSTFVETTQATVLSDLRASLRANKRLDADLEARMRAAIAAFKKKLRHDAEGETW